jgi:NADH:ubiquinone oxidoreductase subunit E
VFAFDMHVHTCLSPCGALDMHPSAIARAAVEAGLDGVVICDHNAADNVAAVGRAARAAGCVAVPGLEITTEEEVHLVALLGDEAAAGVLHARVAAALPGRNAPAAFGEQVIANEDAEVLGFSPSLLSGATSWSVDRAVDEIHRAGGLAIAAHADRERFGIVGQLGFVPPGLALDALEVSCATAYDAGRRRLDPHPPAAIGRGLTYLHLDHAAAAEVHRAIRSEGGREVLGGGRPMEDLALHVLDIARNGAEAGATRIDITVEEDPAAGTLRIVVTDNGRGMDPATAARALDPFYTSRHTRIVGLGLPLLRQAAEAAGGGLTLASVPGEGTRVEAVFGLHHLDRAPLGDLETTVLVLMASHPDLDLDWTHRRGGREYSLATADVRAALDGVPLAAARGGAQRRAGSGRHRRQPNWNGGPAMTDVSKVESIVDRHGRNRDHLIAILLECQEEFLHLPREVIEAVAVRVKAPVSQVLGIATFYRGFSLKPVGRHRIHVCMGTACHVQGAPRLLDAVSRELGIQKGETTLDMEFSLDTVNCLGCCGLAPVVTVGTDVHGKLKQTGIPRMLRKYVKDYKAKTH